MHDIRDFDDLNDRSQELEDELDGVTPEPVTDDELAELLEDADITDDLIDAIDDLDEDDGYTDAEADADTLRSAGWGTDEDYGYYGDNEAWD